ncbi:MULTISPECIES: glycoside hydrolase family 130 protein [unclassified Synechococcus]|uniref:glycoside hydrolase family 130 protein n=1 Tax=unclassified Synechococcus TaxID=2626047 RepID=UPI0021A7B437|nr:MULTISPECIES: glycoside hydrolase family 130 protein [unclassified Synechococcus]MCT0213500.1 glycoside hydrolase family 130 protein [Synechococcus sp. CS-1326]MCT0234657.1 glycoside hydrolase family 130 protein [Synechococcus sp. CS-1327]
MIPRLFSRCLLRADDLAPSQEDLRVVGVLNPGAVATADGVVLLIRVAEAPRQARPGWVGLPRWDPEAGCVITDWLPQHEVIVLDARVVQIRQTGLLRLTSTSHLRVVRSPDGLQLAAAESQILRPSQACEAYGIEDARITPIDDRYYITSVAVSCHGAATTLSSTRDFHSFQHHGVIFCPENKDVVLFPERIGGQYQALHRPTTAHAFCRPEIWLASSPDLLHWGRHQPLLGATAAWDRGRIGAGTPPIRTPEGWLAIYHGNNKGEGESGVGRYGAGLLLLDPDQPALIRRAGKLILVPELDYECRGFVPDVIFPTGIILQGETVLIYCGAADSACGVVALRLSDLLRQP